METLFELEVDICPTCKVLIMRDMMPYHLSFCCEPESNLQGQWFQKCSHCLKEYNQSEQNQHEQNCLESNLRKCKKCHLLHPTLQIQEHQSRCLIKRKLIKKKKLL